MVSATAQDASREQPHGFDLLRLLGAALVLVSHAYLIPTGSEPVPLQYADRGYNWGRLGVFLFFIVSGYLICGSWLRRPELHNFLSKRARRILPALVAMVLITAFILGPLATSVQGYFVDPRTWSFALRNLLILPYQYTLPGVFDGEPVNGVLWTLGIEVIAYCALAALGVLGLLKPKILLIVVAVLTVASWSWLYRGGLEELEPLAIRIGLIAFFLAGAWARAVEWTPTLFSAGVGAAILIVPTFLDLPFSLVVVPGLVPIVIYLGTRPATWARPLVRLGDPSYGAYIYGYVIQQLFVHRLGMEDAPRSVFIAVSLISGALVGYASWHFLERHFLRRAPRPSR